MKEIMRIILHDETHLRMESDWLILISSHSISFEHNNLCAKETF